MNVSEALDLTEQCRDWIAHERDVNGDDGGKLTDFVNALSILLDSQLGASIVLDALHEHSPDTRLSEVKIQRAGMTQAVWLVDVLLASKPQHLSKADEALSAGHAPKTICLGCERKRKLIGRTLDLVVKAAKSGATDAIGDEYEAIRKELSHAD